MEYHSYLVLWLAVNDSRFKAMTKEQQNTIKWACLLHDVSKRHKPIFHGKDHIHPFTGGVAVLRIFSRLGFLQQDLKNHKGQNAVLDL